MTAERKGGRDYVRGNSFIPCYPDVIFVVLLSLSRSVFVLRELSFAWLCVNVPDYIPFPLTQRQQSQCTCFSLKQAICHLQLNSFRLFFLLSLSPSPAVPSGYTWSLKVSLLCLDLFHLFKCQTNTFYFLLSIFIKNLLFLVKMGNVVMQWLRNSCSEYFCHCLFWGSSSFAGEMEKMIKSESEPSHTSASICWPKRSISKQTSNILHKSHISGQSPPCMTYDCFTWPSFLQYTLLLLF